MTTPILELASLTGGYGPTRVIRKIDLVVKHGSITCLLGANGAGKTTLLRAITGMIWRQGCVMFQGEDISSASTEQIARLGIAHVPDGRGTFSNMTVEENLRVGGFTVRSAQDLKERIADIFKIFPRLEERKKQQAGTLSGGEQQMLAIGRALVQRPRLLLLDEPSFGLAPMLIVELFNVLRTTSAVSQMSILLIEQNAALALDLADSAYLIENGQIAMHGSADQLKRSEKVRQSYLGTHS